MSNYDLNFIGHLCIDETIQADGSRSRTFGGAALYGAVAAAIMGKAVVVELKLAQAEAEAANFLREKGIDVLEIPAEKTTQVEVSHPGGNVDKRRIITTNYAGKFTIDEVKCIPARHVHLAGCNDHEFSLEFIQAIRNRCDSLSVDMQCFVRNNDPATGEITFADDPEKQRIISLMDKVKLDIAEAQLLCGTDDLDQAARIVQSWGCAEVMITCAEGVFVRNCEQTDFVPFTNTGLTGRTGRGDTTFGAYLAGRVDNAPAKALRYAAALVSLKMETPGPFAGPFADVQARVEQAYSN